MKHQIIRNRLNRHRLGLRRIYCWVSAVHPSLSEETLTLLVSDAELGARLGGDGIEQAAVPQLDRKVQGGAAVAVGQGHPSPRRQQRLGRGPTPASHRQVERSQAMQGGRICITASLQQKAQSLSD